MLISDEWRDLNARLHAERADFGSKPRTWRYEPLGRLKRDSKSATILDYGCGKAALHAALGSMVRNYDPAIPEYSDPPEPADLVVCWDVLEHVEPECLDSVLDHIQGLARKAVHLIIGTRPDSGKTMADGRNPHLIIEPAEWWLPHLRKRWPVLQGKFTPGELEVQWTCHR